MSEPFFFNNLSQIIYGVLGGYIHWGDNDARYGLNFFERERESISMDDILFYQCPELDGVLLSTFVVSEGQSVFEIFVLCSSSRCSSVQREPWVRIDFILSQQGCKPKSLTSCLVGQNSEPYPTRNLICTKIARSRLFPYLSKTLALFSAASLVR